MHKYIIVGLIMLVLTVQILQYVSYRDIVAEPMGTTPKPIPCIFDAKKYKGNNPDLTTSDPYNLKQHFIHHGLREERSPCGADNINCKFDANKYLSYYGDLRHAYGTNTDYATRHYKLWGINEGRVVCM